ncbi:hypothetical protein DERP_001888 [Dermatophagoides pteronyssinus]|uniref:BRO1 domain-containing protein n=1 Tax=Dermatophagoides pteronyssinus TaxID=6956 RepID=A0ABQ8JBS1_DERPT|nr:hypothetical protein DERP_001888 [Dermatophagoides pteronyssinus]
MMSYFHRNSMKTTQKQPFMLFKADLSKSSKDLLLQLHLEREKVLKLFQESSRSRVQQILEELNQSIVNYTALFRGFAISPLHDLGGLSDTFSIIHPSPLRRMYSFEWTDSIGERQLTIVGDSFVELASILFNYGLWLMKWSTSMSSSKASNRTSSRTSKSKILNSKISRSSSSIIANPIVNRGQTTPISALIKAAGLFRYIRENLGRFLIQSDQENIFGTDLDPDVIRAYEFQCNGEAREFLFLSMIKGKQKKQSKKKTSKSSVKTNKTIDNKKRNISPSFTSKTIEKTQRSLMDLIRLARMTREQYRQSSDSIATSMERRIKKWHCYLLMKKYLFEGWEYILLLQERSQPQPMVDFDYAPLSMDDEKVFWHKINECLQVINILSIKYNKYGQEFAKNDPNSWTSRVIDAKKFLKNFQNHVNMVSEERRIKALSLMADNPITNRTMVSTNILDKFVRPVIFHLPRLHDYWTAVVSLEFGVEIFIPNYDPSSPTNIKVANVNLITPLWPQRFTTLKKTTQDLENFDQSLDGQCPEFRNCCLKLKKLRFELHSMFVEEVNLKTVEKLTDFKQQLFDKFNNYISWAAGLLANNQSRQLFGFCWSSSIDQNIRFIVYDIEFEICSTIYVLAIWLYRSVYDLLLPTDNEKETNWKNRDFDFLIQTLRESAGMFQYLLERTKSNKYFSENDCDFLEPILRSYRNHCLAEAQELLFRLSTISWIQLKVAIRILQLYWAINEDLNDSATITTTNRPECTEKINWRLFCQMKSYLYKALGYFYLSEMYPKSGERTLAALQKCRALFKFFIKQLNDNKQNLPWIVDNKRFDYFEKVIEERFQRMCIHFVLNNHDNYMKKNDINLDTVLLNRQLDSMLLLQPIKFYQPKVDEFWLKDNTIQQALMDLTKTSSTAKEVENATTNVSSSLNFPSKPIAVIKHNLSATKSQLSELERKIPSKTMIIIASPADQKIAIGQKNNNNDDKNINNEDKKPI